MSEGQRTSNLAKYFMWELAAVFYLLGMPLNEAVRMFRNTYIAYAVGKSGSQSKAARLIKCHRHTVNREFNKGLELGPIRDGDNTSPLNGEQPSSNSELAL